MLSPTDGYRLPLTGVRVIDLSRYFPGPLAGLELARFGATVIKVESGSGDPARFIQPMDGALSVPYRLLNGGKACVSLDLRSDSGVQVLKELIAHSDVLIESFRPGRLAEMGLCPKRLLEERPKLIVASLSGFGQENHRGGHDLGFLARSGILGLQGPAKGVPSPPGIPVGDLLGGTYPLVTQVLARLLGVKSGASGGHIDINVVAELQRLAWIGSSLNGFQASGQSRGRGMLTGGLPRYRVYEARDGVFLAIAALEEKFWTEVVRVLAEVVPDLGLHATEEEIASAIAQRDSKFWKARLEPLDLCVELVLEPAPDACLESAIVGADISSDLEQWVAEVSSDVPKLQLVEETEWNGQSSP